MEGCGDKRAVFMGACGGYDEFQILEKGGVATQKAPITGALVLRTIVLPRPRHAREVRVNVEYQATWQHTERTGLWGRLASPTFPDCRWVHGCQ